MRYARTDEGWDRGKLPIINNSSNREHQREYLPAHVRRGGWARLVPAGRKGSPEARLLEHAQRPPAAPPRKLRHKYLTHTRTLPTYG